MANQARFGGQFPQQQFQQPPNQQLNATGNAGFAPFQPTRQFQQQPPISSIPQQQGGFGPLGPAQQQQQVLPQQQGAQQQQLPLRQPAPGQVSRFGRRARPGAGGLTPQDQGQPGAQPVPQQAQAAPVVDTGAQVRRALQEQLGLIL